MNLSKFIFNLQLSPKVVGPLTDRFSAFNSKDVFDASVLARAKYEPTERRIISPQLARMEIKREERKKIAEEKSAFRGARNEQSCYI